PTSMQMQLAAPLRKAKSVNPPVEEPTSSTTSPSNFNPSGSATEANFSPARDTYRRPDSTRTSAPCGTTAPGLSETAPSTKTLPAIIKALASARDPASLLSQSRESSRFFTGVLLLALKVSTGESIYLHF